MNSILGVSGPELHSSGTEPVTFFEAQSSLGGHISRLGGRSSDLGARPRNAPHGAGPKHLHLARNQDFAKQQTRDLNPKVEIFFDQNMPHLGGVLSKQVQL